MCGTAEGGGKREMKQEKIGEEKMELPFRWRELPASFPGRCVISRESPPLTRPVNTGNLTAY